MPSSVGRYRPLRNSTRGTPNLCLQSVDPALQIGRRRGGINRARLQVLLANQAKQEASRILEIRQVTTGESQLNFAITLDTFQRSVSVNVQCSRNVSLQSIPSFLRRINFQEIIQRYYGVIPLYYYLFADRSRISAIVNDSQIGVWRTKMNSSKYRFDYISGTNGLPAPCAAPVRGSRGSQFSQWRRMRGVDGLPNRVCRRRHVIRVIPFFDGSAFSGLKFSNVEEIFLPKLLSYAKLY